MNIRKKLYRHTNIERNGALTIRALSGVSFRVIAKDEDVSLERIRQIVHRVCQFSLPELYMELSEGNPSNRPRFNTIREHSEEFITRIEVKMEEQQKLVSPNEEQIAENVAQMDSEKACAAVA